VLYTGDFSRQEDRHLMSAEIPAIAPDVLIIESTYGTHIHEKREEREARFTGTRRPTESDVSQIPFAPFCRYRLRHCHPRRPLSDSRVCAGPRPGAVAD